MIIKSEFNKNFLKVLTGTGIAQLISILFYPILTRIYSPEDFSELGVYLSVVSILTVFVTLKFEKAIIIPRKDNEAITLMVLATSFSLIISILFLIFFSLFENLFLQIFNLKLSGYVVFIPLTIFSRSLYEVFNIWFNRKKDYKRLSKNRIFTSFFNNSSKIGFKKILNFGALGLILSELLTQIIITISFALPFFKEKKKILTKISFRKLKSVFIKYKNYPIFSLPADLLNIISREAPVLLLSSFYGGGSVGYFILTKKILDMPFTLVSTSILEVFRQKANEDYINFGNCREVFLSTLKKLTVLGIIPCSLIFIFAEYFIPLIFGDEWVIAGTFAKILSIFYFFKFISSPLSFVFLITNKLKLNVILQTIYLSLTILAIYIGYLISNNPNVSLILYSLTSSLVYIVYLFISFRLSKNTGIL